MVLNFYLQSFGEPYQRRQRLNLIKYTKIRQYFFTIQ